MYDPNESWLRYVDNLFLTETAINTLFKNTPYTFTADTERVGDPYFKCYKGDRPTTSFPMLRMHFLKPQVIKGHVQSKGSINVVAWSDISKKDLKIIYKLLNSPVPKNTTKEIIELSNLLPGTPTVYQCLVVIFNEANFDIPYEEGHLMTWNNNPKKLIIPSYDWPVPHYYEPSLDYEEMKLLERVKQLQNAGRRK